MGKDLIKAGADVNAGAGMYTPLMLAELISNEAVIVILDMAGATQ
jgi:hypothetical protein